MKSNNLFGGSKKIPHTESVVEMGVPYWVATVSPHWLAKCHWLDCVLSSITSPDEQSTHQSD